MRIIFMGTPEFALPCLEALAARKKKDELVAVFTQPDRPAGRGQKVAEPAVKVAASRFGLVCHQPDNLKEPKWVSTLQNLKPDLVVVVAYGQILRPEVLGIPRLGYWNIHASLLPRWRGAAPIPWSILTGDAETGVTLMQISQGLDAGDMLLKRSTPIAATDTAQSLHDRLSKLGAEVLLSGLDLLEGNQLHPEPQDVAQVTHAPKLQKDMQWIDARLTGVEIDRKIRGLYPWPGAALRLPEGERLRLHPGTTPIQQIKREGSIAPATLFDRGGQLWLACGDSSLRLERVQQDGRPVVSGTDFIRGMQARLQGADFVLKLPTKVTTA